MASRLEKAPVGGGSGPSEKKDDLPQERFQGYDIKNQYFTGPADGLGAYVSMCVLDPLITIERHHGKYHVAARFHLETTILGYSTQKSNNHELFFQDICLQYLNDEEEEEDLVLEPESDPGGAFTVTRNSTTTTSGTLGITAAQIPTANISLGITRANQLTVGYAVKTWSVSAHRIVNEPQPDNDTMSRRKGERHEIRRELPRYQWFWLGNQEETKILTPDLKHTVKRHIVVKRIIFLENFPVREVEIARGMRRDIGKEEMEEVIRHPGAEITRLLDFKFRVQIRIKRRHGSLHRFFVGGNKVSGSLLSPTYEETFHIRVDPDVADIPLGDTEDISAILEEVKQKYDGKWDALQGKNLGDIRRIHYRKAEYATMRNLQLNVHQKIQRQMQPEFEFVRKKKHERRQAANEKLNFVIGRRM